jgi:hypothetical protein
MPEMKNILAAIGLILISKASAQQLKQRVSGIVSDKHLMMPIKGVRISVDTDSSVVAYTDSNGRYVLDSLALGRLKITASHPDYGETSIPDVLLNSGKELVVNIQMEEQVKEIKTYSLKGKSSRPRTVNEMTLASARTFSVEETQKFAAAVNDPARMATSFAGVLAADDGNNTIVIRGNSPSALLWRMEGIDIPGPNHFSSFNGSGGGISILSAQLLSNSDFLTGAFPAEYGNALGGVFDLKLRKGNSEKREYTFQAGFLGLDAAAEGPLSSKGGSFLFNYRYSTLGIIKKIGVELGPSSTLFQDLSFNICLPTSKIGSISFFGFGGLSTQLQSAKKDSALWKYKTDRYNIFYGSNTGAVGMTHLISLGKRTSLRTVFLTSGNVISDKGEYYQDDYEHTYTHWKTVIGNIKLGFNSTLNHKFSTKVHLRAGLMGTRWIYNNKQKALDTMSVLRTYLDNSGSSDYLQGYAQFKIKASKKLSLFAGLHSMLLLLNKSQVLEPRVSARYELNKKQNLSFGYGMHSQLQLPGVYFAQVKNADGTTDYPNRNLGFSRAHHWVAAYEIYLGSKNRLKLESYYQHLFKIPVGTDINSNLSVLNQNFGVVSEPLTDKGLGRNYGVELTLERSLHKGYYYLLSGSLYKSNYKALNGNWYNTRFNGGHALTFTGGKEFKLKGGKKLLGLNIKTTWFGGFRETPLIDSLSLRYETAVYDHSKPFTIKLPAYFRTDLKFSYRINHKQFNSIWSLDIQNASNRKNLGGTYYDHDKAEIRKWYQTPLIPVFSYKIEF